ncbi:MAG: indolepyruvate oxidoreductase subunit beta family protein [Gammaproteobacteria bacterium]|nr:indolepyruvate oxidoreductase subunit beta family protein [Gammaproteobacteria bacterium]
MNDERPKPISVAILAMGGQGGGVLSDWLVKAGERAGFIAQSTSVPGVAQRTGATVYYLEFFPRAQAAQAGKAPVLALMPVPQDVDIVVAGELIEAGRAIVRGFVTPGRTAVITSDHRDYAISERMAMGDGRADAAHILRVVEQRAARFVCFDMDAAAQQCASAISAVLLGAIAGSGVLPVARNHFEDAIRGSGIAVEGNLRGFASGFDRASHGAAQIRPEPRATTPATPANAAAEKLIERIKAGFPEATWATLSEAVRRLVDYQDVPYAEEYLERVATILKVDESRRGEDPGYRLTETTARHLALWMTYEDAIRVADLKIRSRRIERVREEVRARPNQIVYVTEFMHPRVQEICDVLPAMLGRAIMDNRVPRAILGLFCRKGRRVTTNTVRGFLLLCAIAGLRRWRRYSLRYETEGGHIQSWLSTINTLAGSDYDLAVEVARCQQLVKGYGDTHTRGMSSFRRIMAALNRVRQLEEPAALIAELRQAALADERGEHLDQALSRVGGPRPVTGSKPGFQAA